MIRLDGQKISKSVGNIFVLSEALEQYGHHALLMYFCTGHYRQPVDFDDERLDEAASNVRRLREVGRRLVSGPSPEWSGPLRDEFFDALAEDFNTPRALVEVWAWVRCANRATEPAGDGDAGEPVGDADLREMLEVLGLDGLLDADRGDAPDAVQSLARERQAAREARDWTRADELRREIGELGWEVRDGAAGPELVPRA
jgi:cysteinyl-tRNA synthetase